jgi:hypothetical protein
MSFRAAILPGQFNRKPLLAFSFVVLSGFAAYKAAEFLMNAYLWLLLGILFRLSSLGLAAQQTALVEQTARSARRWMR